MTKDIIDFEAARDRRSEAESEAEQAHWEQVRDQLIAVMKASELSDISLTSATLRALLDWLQDDDTTLQEAKDRVAKTLNAFF